MLYEYWSEGGRECGVDVILGELQISVYNLLCGNGGGDFCRNPAEPVGGMQSHHTRVFIWRNNFLLFTN